MNNKEEKLEGFESFTKRYSVLLFACFLALALAAYITVRVNKQKREFDAAVKTALMTSEGYDEAFINMINKLENELALRASFGYAGRKDPMTGTVRSVVAAPARFASARGAAAKTAAATAAESQEDEAKRSVSAEAADPVRLTAIIFDNTKKIYTAVVMDGERSYSVDVGDRIAGRRITNISSEFIVMESDTERFMYDISGKIIREQK